MSFIVPKKQKAYFKGEYKPIEIVPVLQAFRDTSCNDERVRFYLTHRFSHDMTAFAPVLYSRIEHLSEFIFEGWVSDHDGRFNHFSAPRVQGCYAEVDKLRKLVKWGTKVEIVANLAPDRSFGGILAAVSASLRATRFAVRRTRAPFGHSAHEEFHPIADMAEAANLLAEEAETATRQRKRALAGG